MMGFSLHVSVSGGLEVKHPLRLSAFCYYGLYYPEQWQTILKHIVAHIKVSSSSPAVCMLGNLRPPTVPEPGGGVLIIEPPMSVLSAMRIQGAVQK